MTTNNEDIFPIELEFERSLLAAILIFREDAWARLESAHLTTNSFFRVHHKWIFEAISNPFNSGASVDLMSLYDALGERLYEIPDGPAYLTELISLPISLASLNHYVEKIKNELSIEYLRVVQCYIDWLIDHEQREPNKYASIPEEEIPTRLSDRWQRCGWMHACGIVQSWYSNGRTKRPVLHNICI